MFDDWMEYWALAIAAAVLFATGAVLGGKWVAAGKDAELARLKADHANAQAQQAAANLTRLQAAQARGDALESRLAEAERLRNLNVLEHQREIQRLTRGVPCLNAGTVRLLNEPAGAERLPGTAGQPAAADAAAASDTDVALWIDGARRQYDTCRDRLQALIDWHDPK